MCTVSIIPIVARGADAIRVICNRDEQRARPIALPPVRKVHDGHAAILPIDPKSGGTWVAVSDAGFVAVLLNRNSGDDVIESAGRRSRGEIVPLLLGADDFGAALRGAGRLSAAAFPPFRLVIASRRRILSISSDGRTLRPEESAWERAPVMFASSGLGDALVDGPRRALFEELVSGASPSEWSARQREFHAHTWPDRPQLSVCMSRHDACTVSRTVVDLLPDSALLTYEPAPFSDAGNAAQLQLPLACAAVERFESGEQHISRTCLA